MIHEGRETVRRTELIQPDDAQTRGLARNFVAAGEVIGYLTDTFYALGVDPRREEAIDKVFAMKRRERNKPLLVLISNITVADLFIVNKSRDFVRLAERFWAGEVTIIGKSNPNLPNNLTSSTGTIGLRLPRDPNVCRLIAACGGALTGTSANPTGEPAALSAREVAGYFGEELKLIVDGGAAQSTLPSSIVDVSSDTPRLIREGVITRQELSQIVTFSD